MSAGLAAPLASTLAPQVRVRRRTAWQRRYAGRADLAVLDLDRFARLASPEAARSALADRLAPLRTALLRSPYYLEILAARGLSPRDLVSLDDLRHFPLLDRDTLGKRAFELPALDLDSPEAQEAAIVQSSGSTGAPVSILRDPYDCLHMWSVLRFFCGFLGIALSRRPRVVLLCSLTNGIEYSLRLPLFHDGALHRISLARERPVERLRRLSPDVIFSDPAGLHWLAGQDAPPAKLLLSSAQYFSPQQRAALARATPAPVVNYYASSDAGPIAWECLQAAGRFHLLLPDVWVEQLGGELVLTRLRPSVLPLLRYRTGDRGRVEAERCDCGYRGFSIVGFTGRRECLFVTPDGGRADAWSLVWLFKHYPLRGFRLTQRGTQRFELELELASGKEEGKGLNNDEHPALWSRADLLDRLRRALQLLGFSEPQLEVREVAALATTGEKPEPFRCAVT